MHAFRRRSRTPATRRHRRLPAALAALAILGGAAPSQAERSAGLFVYDVLLVRPLSTVHLLAGTVMFLPAVVLAIPGGTTRDAFNTYIGLPIHELTQRPLGEF